MSTQHLNRASPIRTAARGKRGRVHRSSRDTLHRGGVQANSAELFTRHVPCHCNARNRDAYSTPFPLEPLSTRTRCITVENRTPLSGHSRPACSYSTLSPKRPAALFSLVSLGSFRGCYSHFRKSIMRACCWSIRDFAIPRRSTICLRRSHQYPMYTLLCSVP